MVSTLADVTPSTWQSRGTVVSQAEAVVGRPGTPGSVAGVAKAQLQAHRKAALLLNLAPDLVLASGDLLE
jgi:hypothetical protein